MARWQSANVLQTAEDAKRLWQFSFKGVNPQFAREESRLPTEPLPPKLTSKDWQTLYKPRLNVAWLPADKVFLRVLALPPADTFQETIAMVELQLEKVSPLPVAQIVWSFDLLPKTAGAAQTAIVVIAARHLVEEFLGKLEKENYLADRLEVPFIDRLMAMKADSDGVWVFPGAGSDANTALVAWWYGGALQNVALLHLPAPEDRAAFMRDQIAQMSWAGELEGWLTGPPRHHLVATEELADVWRPLLETPETPVTVLAPAPDKEVASLTARRAAGNEVRPNLVPPEFLARYRQQFVDRIWMRSLGAVLVLYLFGVVAYFAWLQVLEFQVGKKEAEAAALQPAYQNALRLKAQVQVMEDQLNLQFAALECYRAVATLMPEGLTLNNMTFQRGKTFVIYGSADQAAQPQVNEFNDAMRKYTANGEPLFENVKVPSIRFKPGGASLDWDFSAELRRGEGE